MNVDSKIEEEKLNLLPYKPKLELANMTIKKVNKYSFIQVETNFYSVPEYLVGKSVSVKSYFDRIVIYANNSWACEHKKIDGRNELSININHYLKSLLRKPGAIKNSAALKRIPKLKAIYDNHFNVNPKKFIEIILEELIALYPFFLSKSYQSSKILSSFIVIHLILPVIVDTHLFLGGLFYFCVPQIDYSFFKSFTG